MRLLDEATLEASPPPPPLLPPPLPRSEESNADPTSTMTAPTLSSADEATLEASPPPPPPSLPPLRGVMTRLCFSRICFILAARRREEEVVEAVDMLGTVRCVL